MWCGAAFSKYASGATYISAERSDHGSDNANEDMSDRM